jgi:hypothetical protein
MIEDLNFMKHDVRIMGIRNSEFKFTHANGIYGIISSSQSRKGVRGIPSNCYAATHFLYSRPQGLSCVLLSPLKHASMFTNFKVKCFRYDHRKTHKFINGSLLKLNYLIR